MKRKFLLTIAALLCAMGSWAVTGSEITATMTDVFLYNVGAGQYLTAGDWWGTHAAIGTAGMDLDLTKVSDGVYTIGTRQEGSKFMSGVWMDGSSVKYTFAEVDPTNHYYTISWVDNETTNYVYYTGSTVDATADTPNGNAFYWQVVTRADFLASLAGATSASPKDATAAIYNAGFFVFDYATKKNTDFPASRSWQGTQLTDTWGYRFNEAGNAGSNYCVEQAGKSFDNYQSLTGLPIGVYVLKNQGFYRGDKATYLYANDQKVAQTKITSVYDAPDGYTGNDLQRSSYAIGIMDMYHNQTPNVLVTDGNLRIGVTSNGESIDWSLFDNFTLSYLGVPSVDNPIDFTGNPVDMTSRINNPSFSSTYTTGWTVDGTAPNAYNSTYGAYEAYHLTGGLHQDLTSLPNGIYKVTMQATSRIDADSSGTFNLFATTSNGTTKSPATIASHDNFETMAQAFHDDATYARIETYAVVTDGNLTIGHYESNASTWPVFDNYTLTYYGTSSEAYALALASEASKALVSINGMTDGTLKTALNSAYTTHNAEATLANIQWMTFISSAAIELSQASDLSIAANDIATVEYTETTGGSHTTFANAISTFNTTVAEASSVETITSALPTLKAAIKTYINNAEPKNEGEYFDVTCLMANPDFSTGDASGWTYGSAPNVYWSNCEYYEKEFDIYQTVTGLPTGSYSLNVQAFQRPGTASTVYNDYIDGTDNASSVLYINSITSKVKNIAADAQTTQKLGNGNYDWPNDSRVGTEGSYKFLPNSQQGAKLYFDAGLYDATCAAVVTDADEGNLKLGFKSTRDHVSLDWTIFDNFRLRYYGSSLLVYYQQYWPQLKEEVETDLANAAYTNVLVSSEDEAVDAALAATPSTESEYETAISNLATARDNFLAAKTPYDAIVAEKAASAMTQISNNVGTGVFQYNETTNNSLYSAYEAARASVTGYTFTTSSTASGAQTLLTALDEAVENYNNQTLNAPDAEKRYVLNIVDDGQTWNGYAVTFRENCGDNADQGNFGIKYQTPTANTNYNQAIKFTATTGNNYKLSIIRGDGTEMYMTTSKLGYGKDDGTYGDERIRMTSDASKALEVEIRPTSTANQFQLYNSTAPGIIANNGNENMYTANSCNFTIAEASQASVTVSAKAGKYGTAIFPFKPDVSTGFDGITFYSIDGINDVTNRVQLNEVATPVANTPYLIKNTSGDDFSKSVTGWGAAYKDSYDSGDTDIKLTGVYTAAPIAASVDATADTDGAYRYVLQTQDATQAFYNVDANFTATAYKCYLTVKQDKTGGGVKAFFLDFGDADGIQAIDNGQLTIDNEKTEIYNLAGQKMSKLQKGVNIVNGKKLLVK